MSDTDSGSTGLQTRVLHESNRLKETHPATPPTWQTSTSGAEDERDMVADFAQAPGG